MTQSDRNGSLIEAKLDTIILLLALSIAPDTQVLKDRAARLQRAGLAPKDIAALCNTTPNTVSQALAAAKRANKGRRRSRA